MTCKLVAVDMDGTFLNSAGRFDGARFAALRPRLRAAGIVFAIASGNQLWQLRTRFDDVSDLHIIAENGALTADAHRVTRVVPFTARQRRDALAALSSFDDRLVIVSGTHGASALRGLDDDLRALVERHYRRLRPVAAWHEIPDRVLKISMACAPHETDVLLARCRAALPGDLHAVSTGHGSVDISPEGVDKGSALHALGARLGIAPDEMVAFGDGGNDVHMLTLAGTGVAMANAEAEVLACADEIAPSNDESGVLVWLERLLDGLGAGAHHDDGRQDDSEE